MRITFRRLAGLQLSFRRGSARIPRLVGAKLKARRRSRELSLTRKKDVRQGQVKGMASVHGGGLLSRTEEARFRGSQDTRG